MIRTVFIACLFALLAFTTADPTDTEYDCKNVQQLYPTLVCGTCEKIKVHNGEVKEADNYGVCTKCSGDIKANNKKATDAQVAGDKFDAGKWGCNSSILATVFVGLVTFFSF